MTKDDIRAPGVVASLVGAWIAEDQIVKAIAIEVTGLADSGTEEVGI